MAISSLSILGMLFTLLVSFCVPIIAVVLLNKRTKCGFKPALVGAVCFIVFALVLEQLLHALVIPLIVNIPAAYVIYACLAAGLFEETGRLIGLKWLCKSNASLSTGIGYSIGHGGIEAILIAGISSIANLAFVFTYTTSVQSPAVTQTAQLLEETSPSLFFVGGVERIIAMLAHLALSIIVWMVVTKRMAWWGYFAAIICHAVLNLGAALYQVGAPLFGSIVVVEIYTAIIAVLLWVLVIYFYKIGKGKQQTILAEDTSDTLKSSETV